MTMQSDIRRIAVIGSSGAGKSTLARLLGQTTGLPVVHLDQEHWLPGWTEPDPDDWARRLKALAERPEWIIDGQYGKLLYARLMRADLAIWLDLPTRTCLWRVVKRIVMARGRVRADMGAGCPERFDAEFLRYVATFRQFQRPALVAALEQSRARCVWLKTPRDQARFATRLRRDGLSAALSAAAFRAPS